MTTERKPRRRKASITIEVPMKEELVSSPDEKLEWVEVFPQGISVTTGLARPVLILKNKPETEVLPVWMDNLDAGVALAEGNETTGSTPHVVTRKILDAFGWKLEACVFVELVGHHQFVHLGFGGVFDGVRQQKTVRLRAGEAMSLCLHTNARFFATKAYMARCRALNVDIAKFENNLVHGHLPGLTAEIEAKNKPYLQ